MVTVYVTDAPMLFAIDGALTLTVGAVLSIVATVLGPVAAAKFPTASVAVPAATVIPRVPSPVTPETFTVRDVVPDPLTETIPFAVPVLFSVMFAAAKVTLLAPL